MTFHPEFYTCDAEECGKPMELQGYTVLEYPEGVATYAILAKQHEAYHACSWEHARLIRDRFKDAKEKP